MPRILLYGYHIETHYLSLWSEPMVKTSLLGNVLLYGSGYRIRTGVNAVKGHYPRPLDEPTIWKRIWEPLWISFCYRVRVVVTTVITARRSAAFLDHLTVRAYFMTDSKWTPAGVNSLLPMPLTGLVTLMCSHIVPVARATWKRFLKILATVSIDFVALLSSIVASTGLLVNAVCCIFTTVFLLAGGIGFEPMPVGIKIRCLNQLGEPPTFGGSGEIRTHGAFLHFGFQDRRHRPLDHTSQPITVRCHESIANILLCS